MTRCVTSRTVSEIISSIDMPFQFPLPRQFIVDRLIVVLIVVVCIAFPLEVKGHDDGLVVTTDKGKVRGTVGESRQGRKFFSFLGIPYADTPKLFQVAQPPQSWEGILDATKFGSVCLQMDRKTQKVKGEEACLFLNVFTPQVNNPGLISKYPVIVYVHGGAFMYGSGDCFGPNYFLDEDVVLITLNYRLAALGFLSTGDEQIQGNLGLKDQNLALHWVKKNVGVFGGDPDKITLMGESAGAACVHFHVLSPMSKGLFNNAISQSGSALNPWAFHPNPLIAAQEVADDLNCPIEPTSDLVDCLKRKPAREIVQIKLNKWYKDPLVQFGPTLEPEVGKESPFLIREPTQILREGQFNRVPWVAGFTEDEGVLFHSAVIGKNEELRKDLNENWNRIAPLTFWYDHLIQNLSQSQRDHISRLVRGFYFGYEKITADNLDNLTHAYSDSWFNHGVKQAAILQGQFSPVYTFMFTFQGEQSFLQFYYDKVMFPSPLGVGHGDDLQYFFNSPFFKGFKPESKSEQFSKELVKMWASFASSGTMMNTMDKAKVTWLPVSPEELKRDKLNWFHIDWPPRRTLEPEGLTNRLHFWDGIYNLIRSMRQAKQSEEFIHDNHNDIVSIEKQLHDEF